MGSAILFLWIIARLKDSFVNYCISVRGRFWLESHSSWMQNFSLRFIYETFFEFILCAMISLATRDRYTDDNFSSQAEKDAKLNSVGGVYGIVNISFAWATLALCCLLVLYVLGFGWKSFACRSIKVEKPITTRVTHFCQEMSDWISSYRLRNHLRLEYEKKIEAIEFMRQGASMVRNGEDKDLNGSIDLSIASPWIYDVLPPKSAIVPVKTKNTRESIF